MSLYIDYIKVLSFKEEAAEGYNSWLCSPVWVGLSLLSSSPHCKSFLKEDPRPQRLCADAERKRTRNDESSWSNGGHAQHTAGLGAFFGDSGRRVELTAHRWISALVWFCGWYLSLVFLHLLYCFVSSHVSSHSSCAFCSSEVKWSSRGTAKQKWVWLIVLHIVAI